MDMCYTLYRLHEPILSFPRPLIKGQASKCCNSIVPTLIK